MAQEFFRTANIPRRLMPAAIGLGTFTFTMSAFPGTPAIQNAIPMPFFGTTLFAAPGLGLIASAVMLGFGLWWLARSQTAAHRAGSGYSRDPAVSIEAVAEDQALRERAATAREFDLAEMQHGRRGAANPPLLPSVVPLATVLLVNLLMTLVVLPRLDTAFLAEPRWGSTSLAAVGGVWSV